MEEGVDTHHCQALHCLSKLIQVEEDAELDSSLLLCNAIWLPGKFQFICGSGKPGNLSSSTVILNSNQPEYANHSFDFNNAIESCSFSKSMQPKTTTSATKRMKDLEKLFWEECSHYKKKMNLLSTDLGVLITPSVCSFRSLQVYKDIVSSNGRHRSIHSSSAAISMAFLTTEAATSLLRHHPEGCCMVLVEVGEEYISCSVIRLSCIHNHYCKNVIDLENLVKRKQDMIEMNEMKDCDNGVCENSTDFLSYEEEIAVTSIHVEVLHTVGELFHVNSADLDVIALVLRWLSTLLYTEHINDCVSISVIVDIKPGFEKWWKIPSHVRKEVVARFRTLHAGSQQQEILQKNEIVEEQFVEMDEKALESPEMFQELLNDCPSMDFKWKLYHAFLHTVVKHCDFGYVVDRVQSFFIWSQLLQQQQQQQCGDEQVQIELSLLRTAQSVDDSENIPLIVKFEGINNFLDSVQASCVKFLAKKAIIEEYTFRSKQDIPLYKKRRKKHKTDSSFDPFDVINAMVVWHEVETSLDHKKKTSFQSMNSALIDLFPNEKTTNKHPSVYLLPSIALAHGTVILSNYLYNFDFIQKFDTFNRLWIHENLHQRLGNIGIALIDSTEQQQSIHHNVAAWMEQEKTRILWIHTYSLDAQPQEVVCNNPPCHFPCSFVLDTTKIGTDEDEAQLRVIHCDTRKLQNTEGKNVWIDPLWQLWDTYKIPKLYWIHPPTTLSFPDYHEIIPNIKTKDNIVCGTLTCKSNAHCGGQNHDTSLAVSPKWTLAMFHKDSSFDNMNEEADIVFLGQKELPTPSMNEVSHFQLLQMNISHPRKAFSIQIMNLVSDISTLPNPNEAHFHWSDYFTKKQYLWTLATVGGMMTIAYLVSALCFPNPYTTTTLNDSNHCDNHYFVSQFPSSLSRGIK